MRIKLTVSYNGKNYVGWQKQKNGNSIQQEIENALFVLFGKAVEIFGSGRTDAGVHALGQTAHFDADENMLKSFLNNKTKLNCEKLVKAINNNLPNNVAIIKAKQVSKNFHARFSAKQKTYVYLLSWQQTPFNNGLAWNVKIPPNIELMQQGANALIGTHDFSSFCSTKTQVKDFVRTIFSIKIKKEKNSIKFEICGNGFLYNMVRIIVGTLYDVGIQKLKPSDVDLILEGRNRNLAGKTAPAEGLYLKKVGY